MVIRPYVLAHAAALFAVLAAHTCLAQNVTLRERPDLSEVFREQGVTGTFVLYEPAARAMTVVNKDRAATRFTPASTFKIANSLIALETGVVKDETEVIPYGGKPQPIKQWEHDMGMREAMKLSAVPIYQEIARRIGRDRMRDWGERLDYGNTEIGDVIDRFWLDGPLAISAIEQAQFLARLTAGELPVSKRTTAIVKDILVLERRGDAILYGKTGLLPKIGWLAGWVERDGAIKTFALNIDINASADVAKRLPLVLELLRRLGAYG